MTAGEETQQREILTAAHVDHNKGLNAHAFFKLNNRGLSQDLVQDVFAKTWRYLVRGGKIEIMKAFLYHVLNNLIVDKYRKRKAISLDVLLQKGFELKDETSDRMFSVLSGREILFLIQSLPQKYQQVIRMRYVQDLSLKEIAILTGKSRNAIAVQAHRGLQKLKLLYNPL